MNRLNALANYWYNAAEMSLLCLDREGYKTAVKNQHAYCDIIEAIRYRSPVKRDAE